MRLLKSLLLLAVLAPVPAFADRHWSGVDGNGNYYWGNSDCNGHYSGFDGNGNYYWGNVDRNGHYSGFDGNGNYYWGDISDR